MKDAYLDLKRNPPGLIHPGRPVLWMAYVEYPAVMSELSKNRMNVVMKRGRGPNAKGQIVKSRTYIAAKEKLAQAVTEAILEVKAQKGIPDGQNLVREAKLWIAIHLEKRQADSDAANVVDIVCDAVQDATGLNDCWYSLGCVDWSIKTTNPLMRLVVWQEIP